MKFNRNVCAITPSITLAIDAKAKAMKAAGENVLGFAAGEPDFDTPAHIKQAAAEALAKGQTKYTPASGLPALKEAIAEKLLRENGLKYAPGQILVSNGAKHSLYNIIMALCDAGDEVIIPAPFWLSYPEMVALAGGKPVFVAGAESAGFKISPQQLEAAITPRSKLLVLNSPANPLGIVYTAAELRALAEVAVRHGLWIISDEIYEKTVYDGAQAVSVAGLSPEIFARTITVNGFSKAYAMTGWRLGYLAADKEIVAVIDGLQSHSTSGPNTFAQFGAVAALRGPQDEVTAMVRAFDERRQFMYSELTAIPGITCVKPLGAFYMFPNISSFGLDSMALADQFLVKEKVAVVPGKAFGSDRHIRLSYACSLENIHTGLQRLARFTASL